MATHIAIFKNMFAGIMQYMGACRWHWPRHVPPRVVKSVKNLNMVPLFLWTMYLCKYVSIYMNIIYIHMWPMKITHHPPNHPSEIMLLECIQTQIYLTTKYYK